MSFLLCSQALELEQENGDGGGQPHGADPRSGAGHRLHFDHHPRHTPSAYDQRGKTQALMMGITMVVAMVLINERALMMVPTAV